MVAPGFLDRPDVVRWLNGIEPAWTVLDYDSFNALHTESSETTTAIRLKADLQPLELSRSAVTRTALLLLQRAADLAGLKLTATGNLARSVVEEMFGLIEWPNFDKLDFLDFHRVINEPDFWPLHVVRVLTIVTKLTRSHRGNLTLTHLGRRMMGERLGAVNALLFQTALWHLNISYFDRFPLGGWPQSHTGVVLWSLSAAANDWISPEALCRLCTVPVIGVLESDWDLGSSLMEMRVLRSLVWFGLLGSRVEEKPTGVIKRYAYRKTPLFDRFLKFDVQIELPGQRH